MIVDNSEQIKCMLNSVGKQLSELEVAIRGADRPASASAIEGPLGSLRAENAELAQRVHQLKRQLSSLSSCGGNNVNLESAVDADTTAAQPAVAKLQPELKPVIAGGSEESDEQVVSKLDLRVGRIVHVRKHPNADSLYVEQVHFGDVPDKTIVSGLVRHVPLAEMEDRLAVFLCNLKPVKMRGVLSEGMIMCASSEDRTEVLLPPSGSVAGDLVHVGSHPRLPELQLNPKKKMLESVLPLLRTDAQAVATYDGTARWQVLGKGHVAAPTISHGYIK